MRSLPLSPSMSPDQSPFNPDQSPPPQFNPYTPLQLTPVVHYVHPDTIIFTYAVFLLIVMTFAWWFRAKLRVAHQYPRRDPPAAPVASGPAPPSPPPPNVDFRTLIIGLYISVGPYLIGFIYPFYAIAFDNGRFIHYYYPGLRSEAFQKNDPNPFCDFFTFKIQQFMALYGIGVISGLECFVLGCGLFSRRRQITFTPVIILVGVAVSLRRGNWVLLSLGRMLMGAAAGMASQVDPRLIKEFVPEALREVFFAANDISLSLGMISAYGLTMQMTKNDDNVSWAIVIILTFCIGVFYFMISLFLTKLCQDNTILPVTAKGLCRDIRLIFRISLYQIFQGIASLDFIMLYIPVYFEAKDVNVDEAYVGSTLVIAIPMIFMVISLLIRTKRYDTAEMLVIILGLLILLGFLHYQLDRLPTLGSLITDGKTTFATCFAVALIGFSKRDFYANAVPEDVAIAFSIFKQGLSTIVSLVILFLFPPLGCIFELDFLYGFAYGIVLLFLAILAST